MTIHFYLNIEQEQPITTFYDMQINPFKVGDILHLKVNEYFSGTDPDHVAEIRYKENNFLKDFFDRKPVKIVKEGKYIGFNVNNGPMLTIEYHCEYVKEQ